MSLTKRIWIEQDPAYAEDRRKSGEGLREQFNVPAKTRRRNRLADKPHWDPLWEPCLVRAAKQLGHDHIGVNSQMMFRTVEARDAVVTRAEEIWNARAAQMMPYRDFQ